MSSPTGPHHLQREIDQGAGGVYVAQLYSQMRCDGDMGRCKLPPHRAPVIIVPPTPYVLLIEPRKVFTTLHYCERHTREVTVHPADLLHDRLKALIEERCKAKWPQEYRPDFDHAFVKWVLVTTPEYRDFLLRLERNRGVLSGQGIPILGAGR